jgi:phosphate transport system protein
MRAAFDQELARLQARLVIFGRLVQTQLEDTLAAFASADANAIEGIVVRDQHAHQQSAEIEWELLCTLARQAPVASDLRLVAGLLHINEHLERMAICASMLPGPSRSSWSGRHRPRSGPP